MSTPAAKFDIRAQDKTGKSFDAVRGRVKGLRKQFLSLKTAVPFVALVAAGGALAKLANNGVIAGDKINKLSIRLGASTEALSQYKHVAEASGVTFETLSMGWQRMTRRVAEAAQGTGEAKGALFELGLSAKALNELKPEEQFEALADALNGVDNQADKVRLSMKLFDSEGVSLLQTMEAGSAGLRGMRNEADQLGLTLSKSAAEQMSAARDSSNRLKTSVAGLSNVLAVNFGPALISSVTFIRESVIPSLSGFLEKVGLIKREISTMAKVEVLDRISEIHDEMQNMADTVKAQGQPWSSGELIKLKKMSEEIAKLEERLSGLNGTLKTGEAKKNLKITDEDILPASTISNMQGKLQTLLASLETTGMTRLEILNMQHTQGQELLELAYTNKKLTDEKYQSSLVLLETRTAIQREKIEKVLQDKRRRMQFESLNVTGQVFNNLSTLMSTKSKELFDIGKKAALASALINTYQAITKTMSSVPYPWNIPLAAAQGIAGMVQVQNIRSQQFGGGSAGLSVSGGAGGGVTTGSQFNGGAPVAPAQQSSNVDSRQPSGGITTFQLVGQDKTFTSDQVEDMFIRFGEAIERGDKVLFSSNSRQALELSA